MKFVSRGTVAAALSVAAILASSFGKEGLAGYFQSPALVDTVLAVVAGVAAIVAGISDGIKKAPEA